jgi:sugar phosphate isomerase/epimerase
LLLFCAFRASWKTLSFLPRPTRQRFKHPRLHFASNMSTSIPFGIQSYCFREFKDNAVVAGKVRDLGLESLELCAVHADLGNPAEVAKVTDIYRQAGVSIVSIGVQTFTGADSERAWFESAVATGAKHISCHFQVDSFAKAVPRVRRWSREFGIRVGIHCHGGYMFGGQEDVLTYLLELGGPEIGLCIDTAWAMQAAGAKAPLTWAKKFAGRVYGVHFKDFLFEKTGQWKDVIVGTGSLDLPAFMHELREGGFDGMAVIEYEADPENPDPALKRCVDSMRATIG